MLDSAARIEQKKGTWLHPRPAPKCAGGKRKDHLLLDLLVQTAFQDDAHLRLPPLGLAKGFPLPRAGRRPTVRGCGGVRRPRHSVGFAVVAESSGGGQTGSSWIDFQNNSR